MGKLYDLLSKDVRYEESLKACINCGTCSAICNSASFYDYDPLEIMEIVQSEDEKQLENLLKSEKIWYCAECMSCATRCPRNNTVGLMIMALRKLSQDMGYFVESEKGRQQLALKRVIGHSILERGYCVHVDFVTPELHPEAGPVWEWLHQDIKGVFDRIGANYNGDGPGILRKIPQETLDDLKKIFEVTGALEHFDNIEKHSERKAKELGIEFDETGACEYFGKIYTENNGEHTI
jgi:heterodisulfide reductase subunit C